MKKTLIALAALAATSAFAQSSVTLSGAINYGISTSVAGVHGYGGWKGDRNFLNFAVVEDMGGGMKLSANVQARYNSANSGTNTGYLNSTTGLAGDSLFEQSALALDSAVGQVRVGRFTNIIGVAPLHPLEDSGQSTAPHQAANGRHSGQFQYVSPNVAGFQVWALNAQKSQNKFLGAGTGGGYLATNDYSLLESTTASTKVAGSTQRRANLNAVGLNYTQGPVFAQYYQITDLQGQEQTKIGASYDLGVAKLFASQFNQKTAVQSSATAGLAAHKATEIAVTVPYGNFLFTLGQFNANKDMQIGKTDGSTKTSKTGWGANYSLSKRTTLIYAASTTDKGVAAAVANNGGTVTGRNQFVGIQHNF